MRIHSARDQAARAVCAERSGSEQMDAKCSCVCCPTHRLQAPAGVLAAAQLMLYACMLNSPVVLHVSGRAARGRVATIVCSRSHSVRPCACACVQKLIREVAETYKGKAGCLVGTVAGLFACGIGSNYPAQTLRAERVLWGRG